MSQFGQGHEPCKVLAEQKQLTKDTQVADEAVLEKVEKEITAAPGNYQNREAAITNRTIINDRIYCTKDQAASGLCSAEAPRAGRNTKASVLFTPAGKNSTVHEDKTAFINTVIGFAPQPISPTQAATVGGTSYMQNVHRLNAIRSPSMVALKSIEAHYTTNGDQAHFNDEGGSSSATDSDSQPTADQVVATSESGQLDRIAAVDNKGEEVQKAEKKLDIEALPVAVQLEKQVARYLGGSEEYTEWNKTLIEQNDKGL